MGHTGLRLERVAGLKGPFGLPIDLQHEVALYNVTCCRSPHGCDGPRNRLAQSQ